MTRDKIESIEKTTIVRKGKKSNYSIISNSLLQDTRLSWKAKGLLCYLLHLPDDWKINTTHLQKQATDGRHSLKIALKELQEFGYLIHENIRQKGKFIGHLWTVYEEPILKKDIDEKKPEAENQPPAPEAENPPAENQLLPKTNTSLITKKTTTKPPPKKEPDKPKSDSGGGFFNCLKETKISEPDKIRLSSLYSEETVAKVLSYVSRTGFKLKTSLDRAIFYYCKNPEQMTPTKNEIDKQNQQKQDAKNQVLDNRRYFCKLIEKKAPRKSWLIYNTYDCFDIGDYMGNLKQKIYINSMNFEKEIINVIEKFNLNIEIPEYIKNNLLYKF